MGETSRGTARTVFGRLRRPGPRPTKRSARGDDLLLEQCLAMLEHAHGAGNAPPAWVSTLVEQAVRARCEPPAPAPPPVRERVSAHAEAAARREHLVRAHQELSALVAPATPRSLAYLRRYAGDNRVGMLGRIPVVRALLLLSMLFLGAFLLLAAWPAARTAARTEPAATHVAGTTSAAPAQPTAPAQPATTAPPRAEAASPAARRAGLPDTGPTALANAEASGAGVDPPPASRGFGDLLLAEAFLLTAAGVGATSAGLYRASGYVLARTYEPDYNHTYVARVVLGLLGGVILATLVPVGDGGGLAGLGRPLLALLGGFSAPAVYRILVRVVDALETPFRGDPADRAAADVERARNAARDAAAATHARLVGQFVALQSAVDRGNGAEIQTRMADLRRTLVPLDET